MFSSPSPTVKVTGVLLSIRSSNGAWFVGTLERSDGQQLTVKGTAAALPTVGLELELEGKDDHDPKYGRQFKFTNCRIAMPTSSKSIEKFLSQASRIGAKKAQAVYAALGENCLTRIAEDSACLLVVPGLTDKDREALAEYIAQKADTIAVDDQLVKLGFGPKTREKITEKWGTAQLKRILAENPYRMVQIPGVGFRTLDQKIIGYGLMPVDAPERIAAAAVERCKEVTDIEGSSWATTSDVTQWIGRLCQAPSAEAMTAGLDMAVHEDGGLARIYDDEDEVLGYTLQLVDRQERECAEILAQFARPLEREDEPGWDGVPEHKKSILTAEQRGGVENGLEWGVSIITGGPGTGKTTSLTAVLDAIGTRRVVILAPTGKAAKRAAEVTKHPHCMTVHRFAGQLGNRDEEPPRERMTLVLEESSMLSGEVLHMLLRPLSSWPNVRLVIVGDVDQLPPVGWGAFLRDAIASGRLPVTRLTQVHRQAAKSSIISHAHKINAGVAPDSLFDERNERGDWLFLTREKPEEMAALVPLILSKAVVRYGMDLRRDVQVLAPMREGPMGVNNLNGLIRDAFNPRQPGGDEIVNSKTPWNSFRVGEKVMVTKNDYGLEVVNGDVGTVIEVKSKFNPPVVKVELDDGRTVAFEGWDKINILTQAWAMTVHKSQGSEYRLVIVMCPNSRFAAQRKLLYTGITRAREKLVLIGAKKAVIQAVKDVGGTDRRTRLAGLLAEAYGAMEQMRPGGNETETTNTLSQSKGPQDHGQESDEERQQQDDGTGDAGDDARAECA